jgi:hypothetical protein
MKLCVIAREKSDPPQAASAAVLKDLYEHPTNYAPYVSSTAVPARSH